MRKKNMQKIASLMMALVMVFTMNITAFASVAGTGNGIITIDNAVDKQEYRIYKIFDLESYDATADAYAYKINSKWKSFAESKDAEEFIVLNPQGYVTWKMKNEKGEDIGAADFAKKALEYAETNKIVPDRKGTADGSEVQFTGLDLGYYLVDSSTGTLCSLDTTNPIANIKEKNAEPTNEKEVEEDSTGIYGDKNDADIGQIVNFKSTISAQAGAQNYVFHDKMDSGLSFNGKESVSISLNGETVSAPNYEVLSPASDDDTFDIKFTKDFCDSLKENDKIVISYSAVVTEEAKIGGANVNESKLTYGENNNLETQPSTTETYTWEVDIFKYTGADKPLADAKFTLSRNGETDLINFVMVSANTYKACTKAECEHSDHITEITTDSTGKFKLQGLDRATYKLTEIEAPAGYNKLSGPVEITIGEEGAVSVNGTAISNNEVKVENNSGTELPSTGGIGTTIFYIVGGVLVVGAAILLVTKKRMSREQ